MTMYFQRCVYVTEGRFLGTLGLAAGGFSVPRHVIYAQPISVPIYQLSHCQNSFCSRLSPHMKGTTPIYYQKPFDIIGDYLHSSYKFRSTLFSVLVAIILKKKSKVCSDCFMDRNRPRKATRSSGFAGLVLAYGNKTLCNMHRMLPRRFGLLNFLLKSKPRGILSVMDSDSFNQFNMFQLVHVDSSPKFIQVMEF